MDKNTSRCVAKRLRTISKQDYYQLKELEAFARRLKFLHCISRSSLGRSAYNEFLIRTAFFYSAVTMRRISDMRGFSKLKSQKISTFVYSYTGAQDHIPEEVSARNYDSPSVAVEQRPIRDIYNAIIHPHIYEIERGLNNGHLTFAYLCVVSDKEKREKLYAVSIVDWIDAIARFCNDFTEIVQR